MFSEKAHHISGESCSHPSIIELNQGAVVGAKERLRALVTAVKQEGDIHDAIDALAEEDMKLLTLRTVSHSPNSAPLATGLSAVLGGAVGRIYFDTESVQQAHARGESVILFKEKLTSDDIHLFSTLGGLLSTKEDKTSHFSIVARSMNLPFITSLSENIMDLPSGTWVTMDSVAGVVWTGAGRVTSPDLGEEFNHALEILQGIAKLHISANADTPQEAHHAHQMGASHVWPRSEALFFDPSHLKTLRKVILTQSEEQRARLLDELTAIQEEEVLSLLVHMKGADVIVRLLDPPLHEFLPSEEMSKAELAVELNVSLYDLDARIDALREDNPMLGQRGVRLLLTQPDLLRSEVRAIFQAHLHAQTLGLDVEPAILIPFVIDPNEITRTKKVINEVREELEEANQTKISYRLGSMIETPRALRLISEICAQVDFISFGTNDLSALMYGFSRGDVYQKFLSQYLEEGVLKTDPFIEIDSTVKSDICEAVTKAKAANPNLKIDLCGEQGSSGSVVKFCHEAGFTSISCSPARVPVAWLYAAKAALRDQQNGEVK